MFAFKNIPAELRVKIEELCLKTAYDGNAPALLVALIPDAELYQEAFAVYSRVNTRIDHTNGDRFFSLDKKELLRIRYIEIKLPARGEDLDYRLWNNFEFHKHQPSNNLRTITLDFSKIMNMSPFIPHNLTQLIQASRGLKKIVLKFHRFSYQDPSRSDYCLYLQPCVYIIRLLNQNLGVEAIQVPWRSIDSPKISIWKAPDGKFLHWTESFSTPKDAEPFDSLLDKLSVI